MVPLTVAELRYLLNLCILADSDKHKSLRDKLHLAERRQAQRAFVNGA